MSLEENTILKKSTIALLLKMMVSDDKIEIIEERYINYVAKELSLSFTDLEEVRANPSEFELKPPQNEQDRMTILYYLLFTMRIDGAVSKEEEDLCYKYALKLGFNHQMVSDLISVVKSYNKNELPPNSLIKEIKKYMN